jgi:cell division protein FtsZ
VVARIARSLGALTIGVVTRPFTFEGRRRAGSAETGIAELRSEVDTLIVIPNDRLLSISDRQISVLDAFRSADQVLLQGVSGITDLITTPGPDQPRLRRRQVGDVRCGLGTHGHRLARGDDRAVSAAEQAIASPLLEQSIDGAHGVLLSISGGSDLGLFEINNAAQLVATAAHPEANIIFGAVIDDALGDEVRVTVIAAGFAEAPQETAERRPGTLQRPAVPAPRSGTGATGSGARAGDAARARAGGRRRPVRADGPQLATHADGRARRADRGGPRAPGPRLGDPPADRAGPTGPHDGVRRQ